MAYIDNVTNILQIQPDGLPTFVRLSQNENGRNLYFQLAGNEIDIPANSTITISGTKPDGTVYSGTGSISDNVILIPEMIQMTAVAGYWDAKVKIISGGNTIATGRIRFVIDADTVDPDSVPSDSELEGLVAEAQQYAETARTEAYGSPLTATTAAGMTDHTRVYVYTGSETGYTAGHWYYWDGTQWTDGGIYNSTAVNTDPTLTLAGVAADAKATGDAIEAARVAIDDTLSNTGEAADAKVVGDELADVKEDLNSNLKYAIGLEAIEITKRGYYINTSGSTVNINSFIYSPQFNVSVVECNPNDVFTINALGGSSPQAWAFIDASGTVLKKTTTADVNNFVIIAPENSAHLVINDKGNRISYHGETAVNAIASIHEIPTSEVAIIPAVVFPHYPYVDSVTKKIRVTKDTILIDKRLNNGRYYVIPESVDIDYSAVTSTAIAIYYDKDGNTFVCEAYSTNRDASRYILFMLIRTSTISTNPVTVSAGFPVIIDGMIEGVINGCNNNVKSINHRGLMVCAPENTLIAFKYSKTAGFDAVETDIRFTSDGIPVLLHDAIINRTARNTDGTELTENVNIADITYQQALTYDFGIYKGAQFAGTKIPSFEQFIKTCRNLGVHPYIELKTGTEAQIKALYNVVRRNGMDGKCSWISYNMTWLSYIHEVAPKERLGYLASTIAADATLIQLTDLRQDNEVFYDLDSANGVTDEGITRLMNMAIPLELYTGLVESVVNADPYITGFTLSYYIGGRELIRYWDTSLT